MTYQNHFANASSDYFQYRPNYPKQLFDYLAQLTEKQTLAWDCGTGNGQAAIFLAKYFQQVCASDLNQAQLDVAPKLENISYHCWKAEQTALSNQSVDLITIAQALHWFDHEAFYHEVYRVLNPKGIIAAWCYSLGGITPEIDIIIQQLYQSLPWPKERFYIDEGYRTLPFPFQKKKSPEFSLEKEFNLDTFIGYLNTWSAVKEFQKQTQQNPIHSFYPQLQSAWGDPAQKRIMRWPLHLLVGSM